MFKTLAICILTITFAAALQISVYAAEFHMVDGNSVDMVVHVQESGQYHIEFDYLPLSAFLNPEFSVQVNGVLQHTESRRVIAPINWEYPSGEFLLNRQGHEQLPQPSGLREWTTSRIYHANFLATQPLVFELQAGENVITFSHIAGEMLLNTELRMTVPVAAISYSEYRLLHSSHKPGRMGEQFRSSGTSSPNMQITVQA